MFIYNFNLNSKNLVKIGFTIMVIIITIFFLISIYKILSENFKTKDEIIPPDVSYIEPENFTNILKEVYEDLDNYLGQTICFKGYVYRNSDFDENFFVLARDMKSSLENQTLIVGFLCDYKNAKNFADGTWVEVTGTIDKGNYHGEIPVLKVLKIEKCDEPEDPIVPLPDKTYVPTAIIF